MNTTPVSVAAPSAAELDAAVAHLSYEDARSELIEIVAQLEQGNIPLEQSLAMWERGEALARRCEAWLAGARERLTASREATEAAEAISTANETTPISTSEFEETR
ncbi:Exodeoxyribonuclease 7 small subunit [Chlamydia trachomatis]|nr:Exodeoxyribonuclease 7 small subunit [Chlamydia trachomatis]